MNDLFDTGISIEKMAAYLDGNLDTEESLFIEQQMKNIDELKDFMSLSESIDIQMNDLMSNDSYFSDNILSEDFELPEILCPSENNFFGDTVLDDPMFVKQSSFDNESSITENCHDDGDSYAALTDIQDINF